MNLKVEDIFRRFVREFGGELISDLLPTGNPPSNADFLFRRQGVIAELKCLENNSLGSNYPEKMKALTDSWMRRRLMMVFGTRSIEINRLPPECQTEWLNLICEPIQRNIVKKANGQIRETKKWLGLPDVKGLLLIASDGNLVMQPYDVAFFLTRVFQKKTEEGRDQYSNIDAFFHFSVNYLANVPGTQAPVLFSHAGPRSPDDMRMRAFCEELQDAWYAFLCKLTGAPIPTIASTSETIGKIKWI